MPDEQRSKQSRLLRTNDVLRRLNISLSTLMRLRNNGAFPKARRLSSRVLVFDEQEIEDWIKQRPRVGHEAF